jgi:transcriptional regulator with XRE-family HTH domain
MPDAWRWYHQGMRGQSGYVAVGSRSQTAYLEQAIAQTVGARVREERLNRRLTLRDVAPSAGLSEGMLSRIENAQTFPSLRTLARLADILNVPFTSFFKGLEEEHEASFVKAGQGVRLSNPNRTTGHYYEVLAPPSLARRQVEPWLITLPDMDEVFPVFQHEGVEVIYMLEGMMIFRYGRQLYEMEPGDTLLLDDVVPHGPERLIRVPVRFLSVQLDVSGDERRPNSRRRREGRGTPNAIAGLVPRGSALTKRLEEPTA